MVQKEVRGIVTIVTFEHFLPMHYAFDRIDVLGADAKRILRP